MSEPTWAGIDTDRLRALYDEDADLPEPFGTWYHVVFPDCLNEIDRLRAILVEPGASHD